MEGTELYNSLKTSLLTQDMNAEPYKRRVANISWIESLDRNGLRFKEREKQILIANTDFEEDILIQYPGKETIRENGSPWDFRPKVFLKKTEDYVKDFSFSDIFGILFESLESINNKEKEAGVLATLFYRMAWMLDHHPANCPIEVRSVSFDDNGNTCISETTREERPQYYRYIPPAIALSTLKELHEAILDCGGISLEAFLYYIELLAWNEDCKYFYKKNKKRIEENEYRKSIGSTGRTNHLLTLVAIIAFDVYETRLATKLAAILGRFASPPAGIAAAKPEEVIRICKDFIYNA